MKWECLALIKRMKKTPKNITKLVSILEKELGNDYSVSIESSNEDNSNVYAFIDVTKRDAFNIPDKFISKYVKKEFNSTEEIDITKDNEDNIIIEVNYSKKKNINTIANKIINVIYSIEGIDRQVYEMRKERKVLVKRENPFSELNEAKQKVFYIEYSNRGVKFGACICDSKKYKKLKKTPGYKEKYSEELQPNWYGFYSGKIEDYAKKYGIDKDSYFSPDSKGELLGNPDTSNYELIVYSN